MKVLHLALVLTSAFASLSCHEFILEPRPPETVAAQPVFPAVLVGREIAAGPVFDGMIVDAETGRPVQWAHLMLIAPGSPTSSPIAVALSMADGRFRFTSLPDGSYSLRIRSLGYAPQALTVTIRAGWARTLPAIAMVVDSLRIECSLVVTSR